MNRVTDSSIFVALVGRARDSVLREYRRQNAYSLVSALLSGVLVLTFLVDLAVGHPHIERGPTMFWLLCFVILMLIPLQSGQQYPRWAGLVAVAFFAVWSGYFITRTFHAHIELNALFQLPMVALYVGWFYREWIARAALGFNLLTIFCGLIFRVEQPIHVFSSAIAVGYAFFISIFCLEAGSYLRRRALRRASFDPLTRVLNRRGFAQFGARAVAEAHRLETPLTLAIVDFDDFKGVNDAGGHAAGDEALCVTANAWVNGLGSDDLVARIGGDEFALLIHSDRKCAKAQLAEIAAEAPYSWSWGLSQLRSGDTLDDLMVRADVRMYDAKGHREA